MVIIMLQGAGALQYGWLSLFFLFCPYSSGNPRKRHLIKYSEVSSSPWFNTNISAVLVIIGTIGTRILLIFSRWLLSCHPHEILIR